MIDFRDALLKWEDSGNKPTDLLSDERTGTSDPLPQVEKKNSDFMRQLALRLAGACKNELEGIKSTTSPKEIPK